MNLSAIQPGLTGNSREDVANGSNVATALGSGTVDVFATPAMIALMEEAAVAALGGRPAGELTSVGIYLDVQPPGRHAARHDRAGHRHRIAKSMVAS